MEGGKAVSLFLVTPNLFTVLITLERIISSHVIFLQQVGVRLSDGREFFAKTIVSNATRWDTFG